MTTCPREDELLGFVAGKLSPDAASGIEAHIDACSDCRTALSAVAHETAPAASFGRYRLDTVLGSGGMGIVYRAWDDKLARAVAIKIVRRADDEASRHARLTREAQSLARLSHPHVCQVYDVGSEGDDVWVAMELIDGVSLRQWAASQPRDVVLDTLLDAATGIAAAHAAGLVHRDIKPENVLVTRDGRAVVTDFGLAIDNVQEPGVVAGTPAYLAPEQLAGTPVDGRDLRTAGSAPEGRRGSIDARADQFAWAVMAWELLVGERPFPSGPAARLAAVRAGVAPAKGLARPIAVALSRALAAAPADRFATLTELVDRIRVTTRRRRTRRWLAMAVVSTMAAGVAGAAFIELRRDDPAATCARGGERVHVVWNRTRADVLRHAFAATNLAFAADNAERVVAVLDKFVTRFSSDTVDACRATFERGAESPKLLELRRACLERGLTRVDELVGLFAHADAGIVTHAVNAAHAVTDLDACKDVQLLLARQDPPSDPRVHARIVELDGALARAEALDETGNGKASLAIATDVAQAAETIDYFPLRAAAAYRIGVEQRDVGKPEDAEASLQRAAAAAEAGRDDLLGAYAWIRLMAVARVQSHYDEAVRCADQARAKLERIGNPPDVTAYFLIGHAVLEQERDDLQAARADAERALALYEPLGTERPRVVGVLDSLGRIYHDLGENDLALRTAERAAALAEKIRGPDHPLTAEALDGLGIAQGHAGRHQQAAGTLGHALAIRRQVYGNDSDLVASSLNSLAGELHALGDLKGCEEDLVAAIGIRTRLHGPDNSFLLPLEMNLGMLLAGTRPREAIPHLEHGIVVARKLRGPDSVEVAVGLAHLGEAQAEAGDRAAGKASLQQALDLALAKLGPDHPKVAMIWNGLAQVELAAGDTSAEVTALEHAIAIDDRGQREPGDAAGDRFMLAKALVGRDRARARALATKARDSVAATEGAGKLRDEIDAWLRDH